MCTVLPTFFKVLVCLLAAKSASEKLLGMIELTNEAVGDALSDILLVETVLRAKGWNLKDWEASYSDLPSRLLKVTIKVIYYNLKSKKFLAKLVSHCLYIYISTCMCMFR